MLTLPRLLALANEPCTTRTIKRFGSGDFFSWLKKEENGTYIEIQIYPFDEQTKDDLTVAEADTSKHKGTRHYEHPHHSTALVVRIKYDNNGSMTKVKGKRKKLGKVQTLIGSTINQW